MLLGPILQEFKDNRDTLSESLHDMLYEGTRKKRTALALKPVTAENYRPGWCRYHEEHQFLIDHYGVDSVGWGTPFLLVSEAVMIDEETQDLLAKAKEDDLYLSECESPGCAI